MGVTSAAPAEHLEQEPSAVSALLSRLEAERDEALASRDKALAECGKALAECDRLRSAHERLREELQCLKRRIFVAKAERVDVSQLKLEFAMRSAELAALASKRGASGDDPPPPPPPPPPRRSKPRGRRRIEDMDALPVEDLAPSESEPVPDGMRLIGYEESWKLGWRVGGPVRLRIRRPKYEVDGAVGKTITSVPMPAEAFPRLLAAPSLLAHIAVDKFCDGLPLFRQSERFARVGLDLDRGVMARWLEDVGGLIGATVVEAMRKDAIATAFCLATDATGIAIQPPREVDSDGRGSGLRRPAARKPCKRGHIFVVVADRDHVFFSYTPRETSAAVQHMFRGFSGYVQADAKSVYDVLFTPPEARLPLTDDDEPDTGVRVEVGCWAHARRKFWEAALAKNATAREALFRIHRFYELERTWKNEPPSKRGELRRLQLKPELDDFFAWARAEHAKVKDARGSLRSAFGYALRQREALLRPLDDGRLPLDNNRSEHALRRVAVGRKNWLFAGSDEHAEAAVNIMSVIASARLHGIEPERYLRELIRVIPHWPRERLLELAPKFWTATRATLDPTQLDAELGPLTVPDRPSEKEPAS